MGFEIAIDSLVTTLRTALCPASVRLENNLYDGILFPLELRLAHHKDGKSYQRYAVAWVVFCGHTNVFYAMQETHSQQWDQVPLKKWINTSNHDSCWRSDGLSFLTKLYFDMANEINAELVKDGLEEIAPILMNQHCSLGILGSKPFDYVYLTHTRIQNDNYRRRIVGMFRRSGINQTRYGLSTSDKTLTIDATGDKNGYTFLEEYRRKDKRFSRQPISAYVPTAVSEVPLYKVYATCDNPYFSGVKKLTPAERDELRIWTLE